MARTAFIVGGTGQVGRALVQRLVRHGWEVTVAHRGGRSAAELGTGVREVILDRSDAAGLRAAVGSGVDALVDLAAFTEEHADQLAALEGVVGSLVVMSSAAVYTDERGRLLTGAADVETSPRLPVRVPESHATVAPAAPGTPRGMATYAAHKVAMERRLLAGDAPATTVLRPAAIYGPGSSQPREWHVIKRVLDGRTVLVHGFGGEAVFHPVSVHNLSELIRLAAEQPGTRVLNAGDPAPATELEIARSICAAMGAEPAHLLLPGPPPVPTPWSLPHPVVLDTTAAHQTLGYRPVTTYRDAVREIVGWVRDEIARGTWSEEDFWCQVFVGGSADPFDYPAEDAAIAALNAPAVAIS